SSNVEASIVIGEKGAKGRLLRQDVEPSDDAGEGVITGSGILEVVAGPAAGMGEEMTQGDTCGDPFVGETQIRQIGADRNVEFELALLEEAHSDRAGDGLGG